MTKVVVFLPFEAVGAVLGGVVRAVSNGLEVVADAVTPGPPPPPLDFPDPGAAVASSPAPPRRSHVMAEGETLIHVARTELGDPARWPEIMSLNNIADSRKILAGQTVYLPD